MKLRALVNETSHKGLFYEQGSVYFSSEINSNPFGFSWNTQTVCLCEELILLQNLKWESRGKWRI